jgi:hypothetical protein
MISLMGSLEPQTVSMLSGESCVDAATVEAPKLLEPMSLSQVIVGRSADDGLMRPAPDVVNPESISFDHSRHDRRPIRLQELGR